MMRHLLCVLLLAGVTAGTLGCSSDSPAPPAADTNTDLGAPGSMDKGNADSTGSTTN
jgi:hypothetical protein